MSDVTYSYIYGVFSWIPYPQIQNCIVYLVIFLMFFGQDTHDTHTHTHSICPHPGAKLFASQLLLNPVLVAKGRFIIYGDDQVRKSDWNDFFSFFLMPAVVSYQNLKACLDSFYRSWYKIDTVPVTVWSHFMYFSWCKWMFFHVYSIGL